MLIWKKNEQTEILFSLAFRYPVLLLLYAFDERPRVSGRGSHNATPRTSLFTLSLRPSHVPSLLRPWHRAGASCGPRLFSLAAMEIRSLARRTMAAAVCRIVRSDSLNVPHSFERGRCFELINVVVLLSFS